MIFVEAPAYEKNEVIQTIWTLVTGSVGAVLFYWIGFPGPMLTGAAVAVTCAGLAGKKVQIPPILRSVCFGILGIGIGSSVTFDVVWAVVTWPISFMILTLSLIFKIFLCRWIIELYFGFDRLTAGLVSAPGHLSFVLALSEDRNAGVRKVAVVQSIRVLFLSLCVPLLLIALFGDVGVVLMPEARLSILELGFLALGSVVLGRVFIKWRVPAAILIAGMCLSSVTHLAELTPGSLPDGLLFLALVIMGSLIGTRFDGVSRKELFQSLWAGLAVTTVGGIGAFLGAMLVLVLLGLDPALLIVSFAPGGVEAMVAIAAELGLSPAFVAGHHVWRLIVLSFLIHFLSRDRPNDAKG